jgi:hypothetical protein
MVKVKRLHEDARVPTSVVLEELFRDAPPDYVTIAWLIGEPSQALVREANQGKTVWSRAVPYLLGTRQTWRVWR